MRQPTLPGQGEDLHGKAVVWCAGLASFHVYLSFLIRASEFNCFSVHFSDVVVDLCDNANAS